MSIQRYEVFADTGQPEPADYGAFVTYADHVAALAEAEQRGREEAYNEIPAIAVYGERLRSEGYDVGYTAALAAAREAVAGLMPGHYSFQPSTGYNDDALAAIDALRGESNG